MTERESYRQELLSRARMETNDWRTSPKNTDGVLRLRIIIGCLIIAGFVMMKEKNIKLFTIDSDKIIEVIQTDVEIGKEFHL